MPNAITNDLADEIGNLMNSLYGLHVSATRIDLPSADPAAAVATYVDGSDFVRGQIVCDLRCVAILGAALTHIPMAIVDNVLESGELSSNLVANACEVLNIAVNLFSYHHSGRIVLRDVRFLNGAVLPDLQRPQQHLDFRIWIERYGTANLRVTHLH